MTVIVGALCKGGVVMGSDSAVTLGSSPDAPTIEQPIAKKVRVIGDRVLFAATGSVGLDQRVDQVVTAKWGELRSQNTQLTHIDFARHVSGASWVDFKSTHLQRAQLGALLAFPWKQKGKDSYHLCEFSLNDFQPEFLNEDLWFSSMGCGKHIADPFLGFLRRIYWSKTQPTVEEGIFAVVWTLRHAIDVNPGGIQLPIQLGILDPDAKVSWKARMVEADELLEHQNFTEAAEKHLGDFKAKLRDGTGVGIPDIPEAPK